jgi:EAL and modified HD-GYP domain-containing signal transduction protein
MAGINLHNEAFLMGMFSVLDGLLDQPLEQALRLVGLRADITAVLLGVAPKDSVLAKIYRLTRCYELGDWDEVVELSQSCGFPALAAGNAYVEATGWATSMLRATS